MTNKGVIYYTDNRLRQDIMDICQFHISNGAKENGIDEIISISLKPMSFGFNLTLNKERGIETMMEQIIMGLEALNSDNVFFCEHDVIYHPSHFAFTPKRKDTFYYNTNVWKVRASDGLAVWTDDLEQLSGLVCSTELALDFFIKRLTQVKREGHNGHYEPANKQSVGSQLKEDYQSEQPNVCIRHGDNLTKSKWKAEDFKNKKYAKGFKTLTSVPFWGTIKFS